jgi:phage-related protein
VVFCGTALDDLRSFPDAARRRAGYEIDRIQHGFDPDDWKPMQSVGAGVREIRIREASGAFRVVYVAKFGEAVFVLHCFVKKSQKTARADIELASVRYRTILKERER